jgi:hypothetical protein
MGNQLHHPYSNHFAVFSLLHSKDILKNGFNNQNRSMIELSSPRQMTLKNRKEIHRKLKLFNTLCLLQVMGLQLHCTPLQSQQAGFLQPQGSSTGRASWLDIHLVSTQASSHTLTIRAQEMIPPSKDQE